MSEEVTAMKIGTGDYPQRKRPRRRPQRRVPQRRVPPRNSFPLEDSQNGNVAQSSNSLDQIELRMKNIAEFAKYSFALEEKREQSLMTQAGQILTGISVASGALLMGAPIYIKEMKQIKKGLLVFIGAVLLIILTSMVLAVISQLRYEYDTMKNGKKLLEDAEKNAEKHRYQAQYNYQWIDQLSLIQKKKREINDIRSSCIRLSMICFCFAIFILFVGFFILDFIY